MEKTVHDLKAFLGPLDSRKLEHRSRAGKKIQAGTKNLRNQLSKSRERAFKK